MELVLMVLIIFLCLLCASLFCLGLSIGFEQGWKNRGAQDLLDKLEPRDDPSNYVRGGWE